ncbi:hypothetical protein [Microcystis aeruginosa]|jgi:hypothetical protein|uniref:DUF4352 domain-containing protein n=3 Tax=Microcystis TaxID=1125 RepID=A0A552I9X7_MICVR|nr:hypothetical protein [Microcystis aeruginosa]TRU20484.1 MAG: hypothetical protein EWV80_17625 [Microcystis aeruginosa Ma_QC_B_20070730_S2]TRU68229.1 MAG: hypothetical protein EWV47_23340 [Microcystis viridis Mv_BB_P_19951000_S68]TRU77698.1 MAG: hypothetical protein EWV55_04250 [Microcystis viridis Mv_BB_P_19951000_S69]TRU80275.1 MAG: hypothetical protein EWV77_00675 [Microcystis viridis Mv_BB_P_19951000_S68D]TRU86764.1 MAG: hypothetical protein EWV46_09430 [Microcystis viridis Mv_BB_P_19951
MVMKKRFFRWLPILALTTALCSNFYQNHDDIAQARNLRLVSNGFAFEIQNCNKDNNSVVCTFMVANLGEVRDLYFSPTDSIIIDSTGKQLKGSEGTIGAIGPGSALLFRDMPSRVPINGKILFKGNLPGRIVYLRLVGSNFSVEWR